MNEQFKEQITYKAREFATAYTNRHFPNEPAFAFGHEGWAKFVDALVELAGAHPDKGTSALAAPVVPAPGAQDQASLIADAQDAFDAQYPLPSNCTRFTGGYASTGYSAWMAHDHCKKWEGWKAAWLLLAATAPQAAPVAQLSELPEGWVLLPTTPTEEMFAAFCNSASSTRWEDVPDDQKDGVREGMTPAYAAMLAAAPLPPKDAS